MQRARAKVHLALEGVVVVERDGQDVAAEGLGYVGRGANIEPYEALTQLGELVLLLELVKLLLCELLDNVGRSCLSLRRHRR